MEIKGKRFVFLGDSITEGVGVSAPEAAFVERFRSKYQPASAINYGVSGSRIARQRNPDPGNPPHERYFASRVPEMDPDAEVVIVFGGVNDYAHGDAPLGSPEDRTPDTFTGACHTLFGALLRHYPCAVILLLTPLQTTAEPRNKTGTPPPLSEYVRILRETAAVYAIPVLDLYASSGIHAASPLQRERFLPDGIHPNDAGAERIADRLAAFLGQL